MMLFMPTVVLFFQENGMDLQDIMVLQAIYSVTIALIEIPSGYMADVLGRKNSMIVGTTFGFLGMIIYTFSFGFWGFLPAAICLGVGQSFISGSDTALMYDSLLEMNREKDFVKFEGRTISMGNFAEAIAFIIGGFLAEISLRTPFYYQVGIAFTGVVVAFLLVEPATSKLVNGLKHPFKKMKRIIQFSMKENKSLRWNIIYSAVLGCGTLTMAWLVQPIYKELSIDIVYFGIIGAVLNLIVAFSSFYVHKIEEILRTKFLLISFLFLIVGCYFMLSYYFSFWSLGVLVIFYFVRGVATPVLRDYMNRLTPSEMRATVMSIRSFIIRVLFAVCSPFLGYVADVFSLQATFLLSGSIFFVLGGFTLLFLLNTRKKEPVNQF